MRQASIHRPVGQWPQKEAVDALTLDFEARHRRRIKLTTDNGEDVLLNLPRAVAMAHGDGLQLDNGKWLKVEAAVELLVQIRHEDPHQFMRIAWHLGNRHLPTEIQNDVLRIRPDHVIETMLRGFGANLQTVRACFQPEGGAYGGQGDHRGAGHAHHHDDNEHRHD